MRIGKGVEPRRRPALVVAAVPADIGHRIDRGRAADHLAARALDAAPIHRRLGLGEISPIVLALLQHAGPGERDVGSRGGVPAPRPPASNSSTRASLSSLKRLARVQPADPAPTMM